MTRVLLAAAVAATTAAAVGTPGVVVDPIQLTLILLGSVAAAIGLAITSVIRGWLVPRSSHERELKLLQNQLDTVTNMLNARIADVTAILNSRIADVTAERETWRSVARDFEAVNAEVRSQNRMLLEQGKTSTYAVDQIRKALDVIGTVLSAGARPGDVESIRSAIDEIRKTLAAGSPETEVAS